MNFGIDMSAITAADEALAKQERARAERAKGLEQAIDRRWHREPWPLLAPSKALRARREARDRFDGLWDRATKGVGGVA
jgi:hypothetical protein